MKIRIKILAKSEFIVSLAKFIAILVQSTALFATNVVKNTTIIVQCSESASERKIFTFFTCF